MAPASHYEKMLHSNQLRLFLSTEMRPSQGRRDVISVRMDINCLDVLSSFLLVLPFNLCNIKWDGTKAEFLVVASTFHLEEGELHP